MSECDQRWRTRRMNGGLCRYEGWVVVWTLYVSERSLYSMRSDIFRHCGERKMGEIWLDLRRADNEEIQPLLACCQLSSTETDAQCDKLSTVVGRTKLTILATIDAQPTSWPCCLSHWATTSVYSTMRVRQRVARVHLQQPVLVGTQCISDNLQDGGRVSTVIGSVVVRTCN